MAQVPDYLLQRSAERRAALGLPPYGSAAGTPPPAPPEGEAPEGEAPEAKAPEGEAAEAEALRSPLDPELAIAEHRAGSRRLVAGKSPATMRRVALRC